MKPATFIPTASALMLAAAPALAFDIKGIEVGKSDACERFNQLPSTAHRGTCGVGSVAFRQVPFLSGTSRLAVSMNNDGLVVSVLVESFDFEEALEALTAKFGKPEIEESVVHNRMGAAFKQVRATWKSETELLYLVKHYDKINEPVLYLRENRLADLDYDKRREEKAAKNAANL